MQISDDRSTTKSSIESSRGHPPVSNKFASPFRYPGGKGFLTHFIADEMYKRIPNNPREYGEPYCGGAGAAMNLLLSGTVDKIHLNDADFRIYCAWRAIFEESERFSESIAQVSVDLATWRKCLETLHRPREKDYDFNVGFSTFFINRTSRSGVLLGSGPIGGYAQNGEWKIDARFNKNTLTQRVISLSKHRDQAYITCQDGLEFCRTLERKGKLDQTFLFVDPPYVKAGSRLYLDGMNLAKHTALADWLRETKQAKWLLTYDDHPTVRENFRDMDDHSLSVRYSLGKRRLENELMYMSTN